MGWARGGIDWLAGLTRLGQWLCNRRRVRYPSFERCEVLDILDLPDLLLAVPACAQRLDLVFFCEGGDQVDAHEGIICMTSERTILEGWSESFTAVSPSDCCDRKRSFDWPRLVFRLYYRDQASDQQRRGSGLERPVELAANWHCRPVADVRIADLDA